MELKEGMYVRDNEYGIGQVTDICTCEQCEGRGFYEPIISYSDHTEYVSTYNYMQDYEGRASYNIIDLIEFGDFITLGENNYPLQVRNVWEHAGNIHIELSNGAKFEDLHDNKDFKIYSIVTKEQFESMSYKVGD